MMSSIKIVIVLLVLVGTFVVAGPADAGTANFYFYLKNKTNKIEGDGGTRLKVKIYHYNNGKRGSLQKSATVSAGMYHRFAFHFSDCSKTKHREYEVLPINNAGAEGAVLGSGRIRMKTSDGCNSTHVEFQSFIKGGNFANYSCKRLTSGTTHGFYVTVKCRSAGNCEG